MSAAANLHSYPSPENSSYETPSLSLSLTHGTALTPYRSKVFLRNPAALSVSIVLKAEPTISH